MGMGARIRIYDNGEGNGGRRGENEYGNVKDEEGGHGKGRTSRGTCNTTHHLYSLITLIFLRLSHIPLLNMFPIIICPPPHLFHLPHFP